MRRRSDTRTRRAGAGAARSRHSPWSNFCALAAAARAVARGAEREAPTKAAGKPGRREVKPAATSRPDMIWMSTPLCASQAPRVWALLGLRAPASQHHRSCGPHIRAAAPGGGRFPSCWASAQAREVPGWGPPRHRATTNVHVPERGSLGAESRSRVQPGAPTESDLGTTMARRRASDARTVASATSNRPLRMRRTQGTRVPRPPHPWGPAWSRRDPAQPPW